MREGVVPEGGGGEGFDVDCCEGGDVGSCDQTEGAVGGEMVGLKEGLLGRGEGWRGVCLRKRCDEEHAEEGKDDLG